MIRAVAVGWWLLLGWALSAAAGELTFAAYNVENYLEVAPTEAGVKPGKSPASTAALIELIRTLHPDVLGICEMGRPADWADFRRRLDAAGLPYTDFEYVDAADPERHLALASRFPIIARHSATDVSFVLDGVRQKVRRGFLDVTIQAAPGYELRLVGAHLKSKLDDAPADETLIRRHEAHLLREHVAAVLAENPKNHLLVYGDLNSNPDEPALAEILGERGHADALTDLAPKDAVGDRWTQHWAVADLYSRIDYLLASPALLPEVERAKCRVERTPNWARASDHRPVIAVIRTDEPR